MAANGLQQLIRRGYLITNGLLKRQIGRVLGLDLSQHVKFGSQALPPLNLRAIGREDSRVQSGAVSLDALTRRFQLGPCLLGRFVQRPAGVIQIVAGAAFAGLRGAEAEFVASETEQWNRNPRRNAGRYRCQSRGIHHRRAGWRTRKGKP